MIYRLSCIIADMAEKETRGLITGTFDLLHAGHRDLLQRASQQVELLIVGVESDKRVQAEKGSERPVQTQQVRVNQIRDFLPEAKVEMLPQDFDKEEVRQRWVRERQVGLLLTTSDDKYLGNKEKLMKSLDGKVIILEKKIPVSTTLILTERKGKNGKSEDNLCMQ